MLNTSTATYELQFVSNHNSSDNILLTCSRNLICSCLWVTFSSSSFLFFFLIFSSPPLILLLLLTGFLLTSFFCVVLKMVGLQDVVRRLLRSRYHELTTPTGHTFTFSSNFKLKILLLIPLHLYLFFQIVVLHRSSFFVYNSFTIIPTLKCYCQFSNTTVKFIHWNEC